MNIPISFVLDQAKVTYTVRNNQCDIYCPECKRKKLNVNFKKGVYRCNKCASSGGAISLHQKLQGFATYDEAKIDLKKRFNGLPVEKRNSVYAQLEKIQNTIDMKPAPLKIRDQVYRNFLDSQKLSKKHYQNLKDRGLSDEDIKVGMYKTIPTMNLDELAKLSLQGIKFNFSSRVGIPGFYDLTKDPKVVTRKNSGFFCPVMTKDGQISMLQIRYDNLPPTASEKEKENFKKYTCYASTEEKTGCGTSGVENIHYSFWLDPDDPPKVIYLTEGELKANIAMALSKKPFIALIGVNNTSQLLEELKYLKKVGVETICLAVDMDYRDKKEVARAMDKIKGIIKESGLKLVVCSWNSEYKGIDDALFAKQKIYHRIEN